MASAAVCGWSDSDFLFPNAGESGVSCHGGLQKEGLEYLQETRSGILPGFLTYQIVSIPLVLGVLSPKSKTEDFPTFTTPPSRGEFQTCPRVNGGS